MAETFPYPAEDRLYAGGLLPRQAAIPYQFLNHAFVFLPPPVGGVCSRLGWHFPEGFGRLDKPLRPHTSLMNTQVLYCSDETISGAWGFRCFKFAL